MNDIESRTSALEEWRKQLDTDVESWRLRFEGGLPWFFPEGATAVEAETYDPGSGEYTGDVIDKSGAKKPYGTDSVKFKVPGEVVPGSSVGKQFAIMQDYKGNLMATSEIGARKNCMINVRVVSGENPYHVKIRYYDGSGNWIEDTTEIAGVVNEAEPIGSGVLAVGQNYCCWMGYDSGGSPVLKEKPPRKICINGTAYRINKSVVPSSPDVYTLPATPPSRVQHYNQSAGRDDMDRAVVQFDLSDIPKTLRIDSAVLTYKVLGKRTSDTPPFYGFRITLPELDITPGADSASWDAITDGPEVSAISGASLDAPEQFSAEIPLGAIETAHQEGVNFSVGFIGSLEDDLSGDLRFDEIVFGDFQICLLIQHDKSIRSDDYTFTGIEKYEHGATTSYSVQEVSPYRKLVDTDEYRTNLGWIRYDNIPAEYIGQPRRVRLSVHLRNIDKDDPTNLTEFGAYRLTTNFGSGGPTADAAGYNALAVGTKAYTTEKLSTAKDGDVIVFDFGTQIIKSAEEFSLYLDGALAGAGSLTNRFEIVDAWYNIGAENVGFTGYEARNSLAGRYEFAGLAIPSALDVANFPNDGSLPTPAQMKTIKDYIDSLVAGYSIFTPATSATPYPNMTAIRAAAGLTGATWTNGDPTITTGDDYSEVKTILDEVLNWRNVAGSVASGNSWARGFGGRGLTLADAWAAMMADASHSNGASQYHIIQRDDWIGVPSYSALVCRRWWIYDLVLGTTPTHSTTKLLLTLNDGTNFNTVADVETNVPVVVNIYSQAYYAGIDVDSAAIDATGMLLGSIAMDSPGTAKDYTLTLSGYSIVLDKLYLQARFGNDYSIPSGAVTLNKVTGQGPNMNISSLLAVREFNLAWGTAP